MIALRRWLGDGTTWLAAMLCCGVCALAWFGYRAALEWRRSAAQLVDHRGQEAADLLARALIRDMRGVQTSILNSPEQGRRPFDPPYEANDLVAVAFARYPYPEFFFGWTPSSGGVVMFARADRSPPWLPEQNRLDVYPVEAIRNPPGLETLRSRVEQDAAARRRYSIFDLTIHGVPYQVVTLLSYDDAARERLDRAFGVAVNLDWIRANYMGDMVHQVSQVGGSANGIRFAVNDEHGRHVGGSLARSDTSPSPTRTFPLLFFDPTIVAISPPADLAQRSWTIVASAAGDPTFTLAASGAQRSLIVVGAGVAVITVALFATVRAVRASADLTAVRADFVATVTHELKTPLATIRAIGETLVRGRVKTAHDLSRYAGLLVREERRLTRLVNNLLAYSRVTDVTEVYSFESQDPGELIGEAAGGFRRQLTGTDVTIDVGVEPGTPPVRADRTALVLALDNLIDNAIKYSGSARPVSIRAAADGGCVRFDVVDSGAGIPPEDLPQIQRRFVRGRGAPYPGSGLGLAIVNRIANDHGGTFEISSEIGVGTTASLRIPGIRG